MLCFGSKNAPHRRSGGKRYRRPRTVIPAASVIAAPRIVIPAAGVVAIPHTVIPRSVATWESLLDFIPYQKNRQSANSFRNRKKGRRKNSGDIWLKNNEKNR